MKLFSLLTLNFLVLTTLCHGQVKNYLTENSIWNQGMLRKNDGTELMGALNYNFINGALRIRMKQDTAIYSARSVSYFQVIDGNTGNRKEYYSLPINEEKKRKKQVHFLEVVHQLNKTMLLSRHMIEYKTKQVFVGNGTQPTSYRVRSDKVKEVLYLATSKGLVSIYAIRNKDVEMTFQPGALVRGGHNLDKVVEAESITNRNEDWRYKAVDKELLSGVFGKYDIQVRKFINKHKLQTNTIKGLKQVLDYYDGL